MRRARYIVIILLGVITWIGCSSTPPLNLSNQIWFGTLTRAGNEETFARLTFQQEGNDVEGTLELGQTPDTLTLDSELTGLLEGRSLTMNTATNDTVIFGTFNRDGTTFSGTLRFVDEGGNADFALTMTYQQEASSQ